MNDVMVDMETLGTTADAIILSIGAVRFNLETDEIDDNGFYASVSIDSNLEFKRRLQENTLIWWLQQPADAQRVFYEVKDTLPAALQGLSDWIGDDSSTIWSNGADFDIPMLAHTYSQQMMERPWKFWNSRCVRTYRGLPGAKAISVPRMGTHHNALHDAIYQARLVQAIHKALFSKKVVKA